MSRVWITFAFAGLAVVATVLAVREVRRDSGPVVELPDGQAHDFGEVPEGTVVRHEFPIINSGGDVLRLEEPQVGCGCTEAVLTSRQVEPGRTTWLKVAYRARRVKTRDTVTAFVRTDSPQTPGIVFTMTATVRFAVFWSPQTLSFYGVSGQVMAPKDIKFETKASPTMKVDILSASASFLKPRVIESDASGSAITVRVELAEDCPKGSYAEYISVRYTSGDLSDIVQIPVYVMLQ
jgi:hypothetical protein